MTARDMKCKLGEPCERDRIHAPERVPPDELSRMTLCDTHRAELTKQKAAPPPAAPALKRLK